MHFHQQIISRRAACTIAVTLCFELYNLLNLQLVELKNGETYNGHMVQCDSWMNVHLNEVICTGKVGSLCPVR